MAEDKPAKPSTTPDNKASSTPPSTPSTSSSSTAGSVSSPASRSTAAPTGSGTPTSVSEPGTSDAASVGPEDEAGPTAAEEELAELGVDPRLDNRTGKNRPELVEWPAKPQQVDPEHPEDAEKFVKPSFPPAGQHSVGPHGLGVDDDTTPS